MTNIYTINNLQFQYATKVALSLDRICIRKGKATALIGANGSGKSTLLKILAFLEVPKQGNIEFNGRQVSNSKLTHYRRRVGFLAQKPFMLRGTVYDNIDLALKIQGKKHRSQKIQQVLEQLNITHFAKQAAKQLSGGEAQKVALARILVLKPEVLLLDEPFSYLDQSSACDLELFLQHYTQEAGHTLVFSTHDRMQGVALADDVLALADGRQVQSPLLNVFPGTLVGNTFYSEAMQIIVDDIGATGGHASINPQDIILSADALIESEHNTMQGRVFLIADECGQVRVSVDTGVVFQVLISYQTLYALDIKFGERVWVNFKAAAVVVF
ncbi:MAG: tungstate transport system ATP-binding protein [Methyloprofundus sp.]|nr:MAG: tungstate transport system ATP-binding protein [Methyloprofundus sp.]